MDNEQIAELKRLAETANQLHSTVQQEEEFWDKATPFAVMELIEIIERATEAKPSASAAPGMIKRFGPNHWAAGPDGDEFGEQEMGEYVLYEDHVAAIAAAREEGALEREVHLMQSCAPLMDAASAEARIARAEQEVADLRARLAAPEGPVAITDEKALNGIKWYAAPPAEMRNGVNLYAAPQAKAPQQPPAGEDLEGLIPTGWKICTADFSHIAAGKTKPGNVMLVRDVEGTKAWHALDEEARERTDLYIYGTGRTLREAVIHGAAQARATK